MPSCRALKLISSGATVPSDFLRMGCNLANPLRYFPCPVSDDEICACSPERSHQLQDGTFFINPTVLGCRLEHGVFTAHVVARSPHLERVLHPPEYVQHS